MTGLLARTALAAATLAATLGAGRAQSVADFYRGKTVEVYVGYSTGGGYDIYARMLARHMGRFIPGNPTLLPKNMEGAGSLRLANWLANAAPRDGSAFGTIGRGTAFDPVLGQPGAQFVAADLSWIGSMNHEVSICASWQTSGVARFDDLLTKELLVGAVSNNDDTGQFAKVMNTVLGTRLKIVAGYPGGNDVVLAMERGEVHGACASYGQFRIYEQLIRDGKMIFLLRAEESPIPEIPDVPSIFDFAKTTEQRQLMRFIFSSTELGRPYVFPPDVPKERVEIMRKAFADALQDPSLLAEAAKMKMDMSYRPADHLERLVTQVYDTPPDLIEIVKKLVPNQQ